MAGSAGHPRAFCRYPDGKRGWSRLAAGTGDGNPSTTACPRTRSCAWHRCVHVDARGRNLDRVLTEDAARAGARSSRGRLRRLLSETDMRRPGVVIMVVLLALVAAGLTVSASAHSSPCHVAHSCPSDHHSYIWYDAAGQGWDCAKVGAPEVTPADTQRVYYQGLAYQCHGAGGAHTATCGTEAWGVKTLSDPAAQQVDLRPRPTTVSALTALRAPGSIGTRMPGAEMRTWRVRVRLLWQKLEDDSDVHLVVADPATGRTMIAELPSPDCVGAAAGPASAMAAARATLARACGEATTSFTRLSGTATLDGVAFFDFAHGQRGAAPNEVELHPVLHVVPGPVACGG